MDVVKLRAVIGENIRLKRNALGKARKEVAEALGISERRFSGYERGTCDLSCAEFILLAGVLETSCTELCAGTEGADDGWAPTPLDFAVLRKLDLASASTPLPELFCLDGKQDYVLLNKLVYYNIMQLLRHLFLFQETCLE